MAVADTRVFQAAELVDAARREVTTVDDAIRSHPYLDALAAGDVGTADLAEFCGQEYPMIMTDRRSFAYLASRFPEVPAGRFFLQLAQDEWHWLCLLVRFAAAVEVDEERLRAWEPKAGAHAYTLFWSWSALNGSPTDAALAVLVNLATWGANCKRMAESIRAQFEFADQDLEFFDSFAAPAPKFEEAALEVIGAGLRAGDSAARAIRAARLIQAYELSYWDTLADGLS